MNLYKLSWKNMLSRPLSSALSLVLIALGVGIISLLVQLSNHFEEQAEKNLSGIDLVVGAKGSPLQLILSAVYHIDAPTGNIPLEEAEKLGRHPLVAHSIPLSYGDSYQGFRIVGTDRSYPELFQARLKEGNWWSADFEVTLGAVAAEQLNLRMGDSFMGQHGFDQESPEHEEHHYTVTGILENTNSVIDRLILCSTESIWHIHEHDASEADENREITALLVKFRNPMGMMQLPRMINKTTGLQAAMPSYEINRLFELMGVGVDVIKMIAVMIIIVAGLSMFVSLYNSLKERRYEMALMRSMGASRLQLARVVLQEGLLLSSLGFMAGMVISRMGLLALSKLIEKKIHFDFATAMITPDELLLLGATLAVGLLSAFLPAIQIFYVNLSKTLADA